MSIYFVWGQLERIRKKQNFVKDDSKVNIINNILSMDGFYLRVPLGSVKLHQTSFRSRKDVELKLELLNDSENKLENLNVRAKIEGNGLDLLSPPSGVIRIDHLNPGESSPITFSFSPKNRAKTRVVLVIQYVDTVGRKCTDWLGEVGTNFLGCYVKPLILSESEHESERLNFKDNTTHTSLNVEGLQLSKITKIAKAMPGLYLCNLKE